MVFKIFLTYDKKYDMSLVDGFKDNFQTYYQDWNKLEEEIVKVISDDKFTEFYSYSEKLKE